MSRLKESSPSIVSRCQDGQAKMKCSVAFLLLSLLTLTYADKKDLLVLEPNVRELFVKEGATQDLHCYANATSESKLEWEKPSGASTEQRYTASISADNFTKNHSYLKIKGFSSDAAGVYKCKIQIPGNPPQTVSSSIKLELVIEDKTTANFTFEDQSATIACKPNLGPDKEIESVVWIRDNTPVTELKDANRFTSVPENYTLIISKPTRDDANMYIARVTAKNLDKPYDCHVAYSASPFIVEFEKSKNLIQEDNMVLQCNAKGYPRVPISWLKDDKALNMTGAKGRIHLSTYKDFENARLEIKSVEFDDAGDYTCVAHSDTFNHTAKAAITVRVKDKLAALWPFLGIVAEVIVLCTIIFIYEKRRNKQAEQEATTTQETDGSTNNKKEGLRYRNTNNPTA